MGKISENFFFEYNRINPILENYLEPSTDWYKYLSIILVYGKSQTRDNPDIIQKPDFPENFDIPDKVDTLVDFIQNK